MFRKRFSFRKLPRESTRKFLSDPKPIKERKRRSYNKYKSLFSSIQMKQIVRNISDGLTTATKESKRLNIPLSTIRGWVNRGEQVSVKRKKGGGRKTLLTKEFEIENYNWLMEKRGEGAPITTDIFLSHIKDSFRNHQLLRKNSKKPVFSRGFLTQYMKRFHLSLRTSSVVTPASLVQGTQLCDNIIKLWMTTNNYRSQYNIPLSRIINIDEVPVWFDNSSLKVLDKKNAKHVRNKSNGRQKLRMTVILAICADGSKLPPLLIYKSLGRSEELHEYFFQKYDNEMFFTTARKATSNIPIFIDYLAKLFPTDEHKVLLIDSSNTHGWKPALKKIDGDVDTFMKSRNLHVGVVPEHCTPIVQPLDTHVNKVFKTKMKKDWAQYMTSNINNLSANGTVINCMVEARKVHSELVYQSWLSLDSRLIKKSFIDCGFSLALDGSEEDRCRVHMKNY
jgi:hypothetical protein